MNKKSIQCYLRSEAFFDIDVKNGTAVSVNILLSIVSVTFTTDTVDVSKLLNVVDVNEAVLATSVDVGPVRFVLDAIVIVIDDCDMSDVGLLVANAL